MSKKFYIYLITNKISNKKYIGSRIKYQGAPENDHYMGSCTNLNQDYKKIEKENFTKEILIEKDYIGKEDLLNTEAQFILKFNTLAPVGYNRQLPNQYPGYFMLGYKFSEKSKEKLKGRIPWNKGIKYSSDQKINMGCSEEKKKKIGEAQIGPKNHMYGKKVSEETKRKMRKPHKKLSEETKQKMRKPKSLETKEKMRKSTLLSIQRPEIIENTRIGIQKYQEKRKVLKSV